MSNIPPELIFDILLQLQLPTLFAPFYWRLLPHIYFKLPFDNDETLGTATIIGCLIQSKGPVKYTTGIVGYANGLVCIQIHNYIDGDIALWNPSIQKLKKIPLITHEPHAQPSPKYGFGYDSTNDDYKLVGIIRKPANEYGYVTVSYEILTLDLASEKYREFSIPVDRIDNIERSGPDLDVLGDHMCIRVNRFMSRSEAWIMKEYGGTESWSLLYSIDMGPVCKPREYQSFKPLVFSKNGEVFLLKKDCKGCSLVWKVSASMTMWATPMAWFSSPTISMGFLCGTRQKSKKIPYTAFEPPWSHKEIWIAVLNGALSWLIFSDDLDESPVTILTLDLASQKYRDFPSQRIGLTFTIFCRSWKSRSDAWIMKEYEGDRIFGAFFILLPCWDLGILLSLGCPTCKPLVFSKKGEMVSFEGGMPKLLGYIYLLDNEYQNKILIIDPASEKYHEFPIPVDLDVMEGHLCISVYNFIKSRREAWVMKEYGVTKFWSLLYSIDELGLGAYRSKPWAGSFEGGLRRF
ncbi:hypothetical protein L3X38_000739 [Prunus dulcis]|uniref:F-box associated beta-propeller type 3 domain-containing protein n=1 Tax=Prunus dulcis TaxID=3755 RepID=A0AAD4WT83_PRUDU|nr:hypothetical protein L3X38_000739 [Prunus dulcis]